LCGKPWTVVGMAMASNGQQCATITLLHFVRQTLDTVVNMAMASNAPAR
jgi:hypothetical protein